MYHCFSHGIKLYTSSKSNIAIELYINNKGTWIIVREQIYTEKCKTIKLEIYIKIEENIKGKSEKNLIRKLNVTLWITRLGCPI